MDNEASSAINYDIDFAKSIKPNNIIAQIRNEFPNPPDDSIIPIEKFKPYLDSILILYKNTDNVLQEYFKLLSGIIGSHINFEDLKQSIDSIFSVEKDSDNYNKLLYLLRKNRYIIYLSQYIDVINQSMLDNIEYPVFLTTNINSVTNKKEYFNIFNVFTLDCILYEYDIYSEYPDMQLAVAGYVLSATNTLTNITSTISNFFEYITRKQLIPRTYYIIHGVPTTHLGRVPNNKIVVITNPFNRIGYTALGKLRAAEWMLGSDNLAKFIASPTCFIDKFIAGEHNTDPNAEPGINGYQIYYSGQTFFDISLSVDTEDMDTGLFGKYVLNDSGTFEKKQLIPSGNNTYETTLNSLLQSLPADNPEIIVIDCCLGANETISNSIIELTYRYIKLHNIITDDLGICYTPYGEIPHLKPSPFKLNYDYTMLYMKKKGHT